MTAPLTIDVPTAARRELHTGWAVTAASGPVPEPFAAARGEIAAAVPGCVHTDLMSAGVIPDPYLDDNESLLAWIGRVDWTYRTSFDWAPDGHDRHDLVFSGLDTVAVVRLNGRVVLESFNQHRSYRVDVRDVLVEGENALEVALRAPVSYANEVSQRLGARPRPYPLPYEAIRKSACSFGWDWGIATYTSGIWRPVALESWSTARIAETRWTAEPAGDGGRLSVELRLEREADEPLTAAVSIAGETREVEVPAGSAVARVVVEIERAERWWPIGHGDQPLYGASVVLRTSSGTEIDRAERRVGFRTLEWNTTPDEAGTPFALTINGRAIFAKGVNWIPDDALTVRVDRARYERRLRQAAAAGINLVRVWGGGIYESNDFYDLCDELGLVTWQDFLFACAAYPEEEPLRGEIEAEAREQIVRLSSHASLALLTGNNENLWGFEDWGWKASLDGMTWGAHYYHELFPALVAELAPHVPYSPGSPFSPGGQHPNDEPHGTMHLWEQWNRLDYETYAEHTPRFVAEFGWQGPPAWTTMTRAIGDSPLTPESPGMIVHQKAMEGNAKLTNGLLPHFRMPRDMEAWHWAMQLNQAHAVRFALEHFRSHAPHTMGAVVWQLNDCWPVTSWAAIDGDERLKPLWFALKAAFAAQAASIQPRDGGLAVVVTNETGEDWTGELRVRRVAYDGRVLAEETSEVTTPAWGTAGVRIGGAVAEAGDAARELLFASVAGGRDSDARAFRFFAEPRDTALAAADMSIRTERVDGGTEVTVTANGLVRDLTLLVDKADPTAVTEQGLVTLLPGESATFAVRHAPGVDPAAFASSRVVRTANELVAP